ncbi:MAG: hypothetical protein ACN6OB_11505 [Chryseobacterium jejuense]|uniref:hypothetical protein n=1 Tax=Chryseobacterium jejuense TaxID=445960 RepID=UPI003D0ADD65
MDKVFFFVTIFFIQFFFSQKIEYGKYTSSNGSFFILNKDKTFYFQKQRILKLDVDSKEIIMKSYGHFIQNDNLLLLTSPKKAYKDSLNNENFKIKEITDSKNLDSINIKFTKKNALLKIFICGTGIEYTNSLEDTSGCFFLKENRKTPIFYSDKIFFRIYPNFDNVELRRDYKINTPYIDTNYFIKKEINSDLLIDVNFDSNNFSFTNFEEDLVLIVNNKLIFKGEEFTKSMSK